MWNENMPFLPDPELPGGSWELEGNPYRMALLYCQKKEKKKKYAFYMRLKTA